MNKTILAIDPAVRVTGYSVLQVLDGTPKITNLSVIDTGKMHKDATLQSRVNFVLSRFAVLVNRFNQSGNRDFFVTIEYPCGASHGSKGGIGRAVKLYPVFSVAFALAGYCFSKSINHKMILPREWQPRILGDYKEEDSKKASLAAANKILSSMNLQNVLKTKKDENIADAVNIAYRTYLSFKEG